MMPVWDDVCEVFECAGVRALGARASDVVRRVLAWPVARRGVAEHRQGIHTGRGNSSPAGVLEPTLGGIHIERGNSSEGRSVT